jgi:tetratricopeptide (TPR) repeat protein
MKRVTVSAVLACGLLSVHLQAQQTSSDAGLRARAEAAVRDNRPAEAITLLESSVRGGSVDWTTRLVYVVALIADGRIPAAESEIAAMEGLASANRAQLGVLRASMARVKAAKETASRLGPMIERGEVRAALKALESAPADDPGSVFARAYLFRLLGEFDQAERLLTDAQTKAPASGAARFGRALADSKNQRAAFEAAVEQFDSFVVSNLRSKPPNGCGDSVDFGACEQQAINNASEAAEALFALAPFSVPALSGRLVQAIWTAKDDDALDLVRKARSNHKLLVVPSQVKPEIGEHAKGYLIFYFDSNEIEWLDGGEPVWMTRSFASTERYQGVRYLSEKKAKIPPSRTRIPFAQVKDFDQQLDTSSSRFVVFRSVAFKTGTGSLGGIPQSEIFASVFQEIPFRLAMRTYGRVVAEAIGLPASKYKLVGETPSHRGAMFSGIINSATAGLAQANGDVATSSQAARQANEAFAKRDAAIGREQQAKLTWQQQMSNVRLTLDSTQIQAEVAALLDEALVPASEAPKR